MLLGRSLLTVATIHAHHATTLKGVEDGDDANESEEETVAKPKSKPKAKKREIASNPASKKTKKTATVVVESSDEVWCSYFDRILQLPLMWGFTDVAEVEASTHVIQCIPLGVSALLPPTINSVATRWHCHNTDDSRTVTTMDSVATLMTSHVSDDVTLLPLPP
jgi:hypothetical protein